MSSYPKLFGLCFKIKSFKQDSNSHSESLEHYTLKRQYITSLLVGQDAALFSDERSRGNTFAVT